MTDHLTREQLLNYLDGELPRRSLRTARNHIQSCWACRTEVERLQNDIGLIHDAQKRLLSALIPPPPQLWPRLEPRLRGAERPRGLHLPRFWRKFNLTAPSVPVVMALVSLVAAIALFWFSPESVSAKEVLRRASEADSKGLAPPTDHFVRERVRVTRTNPGSRTKQNGQVDSWRSTEQAYWKIDPSDTVALNLQRRYQVHNVFDVPLSSVSYQIWANETAAGGIVTGQSGALEVSFVAARVSGPDDLKSMSLSVRAGDWHVTGMDLNFADVQFEVTEEELSVLPRSEVPTDILAKIEPPTYNPKTNGILSGTIARPSLSPASQPRPDLDDIEMDVRYVLHLIGADLGDPVEIVRNSSNRIVLRASAMPVERRKLLAQLLQDKPNVDLEIQPSKSSVDVNDLGPQIRDSFSAAPTDPDRKADQQRLATWFGDAKTQENFTRSVLLSSTDLLARLYAVKQITDRWPPEARNGLSASSREKFATAIQENVTAAEQRHTELLLLLKPLGAEFTKPQEKAAPASAPHGELDPPSSALAKAKDADLLLRSLFTTSARTTTLSDGLLQIQQDLEDVGRAIVAINVSKP
jgi:hypothetical protein